MKDKIGAIILGAAGILAGAGFVMAVNNAASLGYDVPG